MLVPCLSKCAALPALWLKVVAGGWEAQPHLLVEVQICVKLILAYDKMCPKTFTYKETLCFNPSRPEFSVYL